MLTLMVHHEDLITPAQLFKMWTNIINCINLNLVDNVLVFPILICWMVTYLVGSTIQRLNKARASCILSQTIIIYYCQDRLVHIFSVT